MASLMGGHEGCPEDMYVKISTRLQENTDISMTLLKSDLTIRRLPVPQLNPFPDQRDQLTSLALVLIYLNLSSLLEPTQAPAVIFQLPILRVNR